MVPDQPVRMLNPRLGGPPSKARSDSIFFLFPFLLEIAKSGVSLMGVVVWMQEEVLLGWEVSVWRWVGDSM